MTTTPIELDKLAYTLPKLAIAVDMSIDTIRKHITAGNLVPSYPNTRPVVTRAEAERWLANLPTEVPE